MKIQEQFNLISQSYDKNRRIFIPCFEDYYKTTTDFIAANIKSPKCIMDLGAGTGLLDYYWYKNFPNAEYVLLDIADDMLDVARERFKGLENVKYAMCDYTKTLPTSNCDCVISALSIHHLDDCRKKELFKRIYDVLPNGGIFVNYDQFCAETLSMNKWFNDYWIHHLEDSDLTEKDIRLWKERRKLDKECSVEAETKMMEECQFKEVKCVYSYQKFSVIVAIK